VTQRGDSVDWDRLADHLGGALTGTPDEAEVARLVATDPNWAHAAGQLEAAFEAVAADLRSLPEPSLPDDVATRLAGALRTAPHLTPAAGPDPTPTGAEPTAPEPAGTGPAPGRRRGAVPATASRPTDASSRPAGRPAARPRRWRGTRLGAGVAVAAGVVAFAAIGFSALSPSFLPGGADDSDTAGQAGAPEQSALIEQPGGDPVMLASGTDYRPPTITGQEPELAVPGTQGTPRLAPAEPGEEDPGNQTDIETDSPAPLPAPTVLDPDRRIPEVVPPSLAALWADPAVRARCLELIRAELAPAPAVINTVDFARFEGEDALVVWATTADGARVVWVSGPACGTREAGPDRKFQTTG